MGEHSDDDRMGGRGIVGNRKENPMTNHEWRNPKSEGSPKFQSHPFL